uniref:Major facilitator superfamily (MFS) profile domain-containing protein n=1 Tax=Acrobeloides nanus TaxID=290746 RepID=A0A914CCA0_9BILA
MDTDDFIVKRIPKAARPFVVIGAGIVLQATYGIVYTFGNILPYLVSYLRWKVDPNQTNGSMIWLQSLMNGIPFSMVLGGYLERKIGGRKGAIFGSIIYTGSMALSYFSIEHSYFLLLLTFGCMQSFGQGVSYNCILIQAQRWMPHRVGLASGLIVAGFGLGGFFISPLQTKYINPKNLPAGPDGFFTQREILEKVPSLFILMAIVFGITQLIALCFLAEPKNPDEIETQSLISMESTPDLSSRQIVYSSTFKLLFATLFLNAIWCQTTSGFFKAYGMTFIHDDFFLAMISSFAAMANCTSRVLWGLFVDKTSYQTSMMIACTVGSALMWTLATIRWLEDRSFYFLWICGMFTCIGGTYTLVPYACHKSFGSYNFGIAYGLLQLSLVITDYF